MCPQGNEVDGWVSDPCALEVDQSRGQPGRRIDEDVLRAQVVVDQAARYVEG